ncbi:hypothetical protein F5Y10DRAFT_221709 [Nemania abortiva]|nr:hypothetical protein F5Y10DRAFT_221709 [Nemania abortiva]
MSVFSIIRRGRAQAKEHNAKQADKEKSEAVKLPYKHVPTHAATDALATAPASWKHDDRPRIREQNRRRSAMAANGSHGGLPRVGSNLSQVSYPSVYATPVVPLPKNYSYSSIPSSWRERMASTPEASEEPDYFSPRDYKGKGKERMPSFTVGTGGTASPMLSSGRTSPLPSRAAVPVTVGVSGGGGGSVGMAIGRGLENSSGSEDEREMKKHVKNVSFSTEPRPPSSRDSSTTGERMHRLHPAHARKMSESRALPNSDRHYPPPARSTFFSFSGPRPTSRRNHSVDMSTTPGPGFPGQVYGAPSSAASSVTSIGMAISTAPTSANSTPPPSTLGDSIASEIHTFQLPATVNMGAPVAHSRRSSLSEYLRTSSDTIRLPSNETRGRPQSQAQAPSTRGRRLSKLRPRESGETERSASITRIFAREAPITKPTLTQTTHMVHEPNRLESQTLYGLDASSNFSKQNQTRGKLSKNRTSRKDGLDHAQTGTSTRWSFFSRRNSITGA